MALRTSLPGIAATLLWLLTAAPSGAEPQGSSTGASLSGIELRPGHPDPFVLGYELAEDSVSPDGRYGVIYGVLDLFADDIDAMANFLVELKPFRIVGKIDCTPYFRNRNHGGLAASWARDSSAVLVTSDSKWMPENILLVELNNGRIVRQTDLLSSFLRAMEKDARKCVPDDPTIASLQGEWKIDEKRRIRVDCTAETNAKHFPDQQSWEGRFRGLWSIAERRWVEQKVTRTFCGKYSEDQ